MAAVLDSPIAVTLDRPCVLRRLVNHLMNRKTIWQEGQNKPTMIVSDLQKYAPADVVYEALLRRGVFKWLAVRRSLIGWKDELRGRITTSIERQRDLKERMRIIYGFTEVGPQRHRALRKLSRKVAEERGYRRGIEQCRAEVRAMCHSDRWQAPDNDRAAKQWLLLRGEVL